MMKFQSQFHYGSIKIDFSIASIIYFSGYVKLWFLSLLMVTPRLGSVWQLENFCHSSTVRLCRNYVKELTLNPSLGKRGTFPPFSSQEKGERGMSYSICLLRLSLKTKSVSRKTTKPSIFFNFSIFVQFFNTTPLQNWISSPLKWISSLLNWISSSLRWISSPLNWTSSPFYWISSPLKWTSSPLRWISFLLKWISSPRNWTNSPLKWGGVLLKWGGILPKWGGILLK